MASAHTAPPPGSARAAPAQPAPTADDVARRIIELINAGDVDALFAMFDPRMRAAVPPDALREFVGRVRAHRGRLISLERDDAEERRLEGSFRVRTQRSDAEMRLRLGPDGLVAGFTITEPPAADPPVARTEIPLGLPVRGRWHVSSGGDRLELNKHVLAKSQRRAADLVILDAEGRSHRGDGKRNEDYYAWGREVVAVADGRVIQVVDGVPENRPRSMNRYFVPGNVVVIEHSTTLHSLYAHLQPGKLRVKPGARIKRGAVVGLCGNSGNSSEPHLHFQLQDGPLMEDSWGVEGVFSGVRVTRGGQTSTPDAYTFLKADEIETLP